MYKDSNIVLNNLKNSIVSALIKQDRVSKKEMALCPLNTHLLLVVAITDAGKFLEYDMSSNSFIGRFYGFALVSETSLFNV